MTNEMGKYKSKDKTQQEIQLDETYLLCVDPQNLEQYLLNIGKKKAEFKIQDQISNLEMIQNKIKRHKYIMEELLRLESSPDDQTWTLGDEEAAEIKRYRRQMILPYLLHEESHKYPRYVDQSDLPQKNLKNPAEDIFIDIKVLISSDFYKKNDYKQKKTINSEPDQKNYVEIMQVFLLDTADKLTRKVQKRVDKLLGFKVSSKSDPLKYILKFRNVESYIFGKEQLIYFQEIREFLRKNKFSGDEKQQLELVVLEMNTEFKECNFPPMYNRQFELVKRENRSRGSTIRQGTFFSESLPVMRSSSKNVDIGSQLKIRETQIGKNELESRSSDILRMSHSPNIKVIDPDQNEQIAARYQEESIFFWYMPNNFNNQPEKIAKSQNSIQYESFYNHEDLGKFIFSCNLINDFKMQVLGINNIVQQIEKYILTTQEEQKENGKQSKKGNKPVILELEQITIDLQEKPKKFDSNENKKIEGLEFESSHFDILSAQERDKFNEQQESPKITKENLAFTKKSGKSSHHQKKPKTFFVNFRSVIVQVQVYLGSKEITEPLYTNPGIFNDNVMLGDTLKFRKRKYNKVQSNILDLANLPSYSRICFSIIGFDIDSQKLKNRIVKGYVLGSASISLFDYDKILRGGIQKLKVWPLTKYDPRIVCQTQCNTLEQKHINQKFDDSQEMTLIIGFLNFNKPVKWALKSQVSEQKQQFIESEIVESDLFNKTDLKNDSQQRQDTQVIDKEGDYLREVKRMLDRYPLEEKEEDDYHPKIIIQNRKYVDILPSFIKAVDFTYKKYRDICYTYLLKSEKAQNLQPDVALALLDSKFGDERIRQFAVDKIKSLDDYMLALYMPQLVQALKAELFHQSYLSEMLLERAIRNTGVVGHAFFWALKSSLHEKSSFERFYLILERFLMCCGRFKFTLYNQSLVNRALMETSKMQQEYRDKITHEKFLAHDKRQKSILNTVLKLKAFEIKEKIKYILLNEYNIFKLEELHEINQRYEKIFAQILYIRLAIKPEDASNPIKFEDYQDQILIDPKEEILFYFPLEPKKPVIGFLENKSIYFSSKKLPLMIVSQLKQDNIEKDTMLYVNREFEDLQSFKEEAKGNEVQLLKIIFKYGDDLRQDNLVLQLFKLMDKLWIEQDLNLEMIAYSIFEIGYQMGYLELVDDSIEFADIYKAIGARSPFEEETFYKYAETIFKPIDEKRQKDNYDDKSQIKRKQFHQNFLRSLACQCVATYILSIGDRHCGNYMLQKTSGKFFHIDFGHFMGSKKKKFGLKIEVEPFIYQKQFNYFLINFKTEDADIEKKKSIINQENQDSQQDAKEDLPKKKKSIDNVGAINTDKTDKNLQDLQKLCCQAFRILRQNSHFLINVLMLMVVSGIDQLTEKGIMDLVQRLKLNVSDEEAENDFRKQMQIALGVRRRRIFDYMHVGIHQHKRNKFSNIFRCVCCCCCI
ncbi:phosphatidylinositol 3-and 4-kinase family protein [Stylonychia lemnae]|uniref:Phosphatidylinositol 3-and 4-kinase family protein n=1 Tax=Stylonychia lemnae TaxID=5949 RepID=A0A078AKH9_STYLE|nr:phosphatidylinositol 3-and 4-kinase family protein [Stylonychia lemnae]|eukprot:CDW82376.1 phosphatidylinositol 3-and 4-kinase family protein [Stylonychia lemnae]